jgi:hypothetical protein
MKIKRPILALILCCLLFALVGWTAARSTAPARVQWEYSRIMFRDDPGAVAKRLDELGADGWEIIQYYPERDGGFLGLYLLKRQKWGMRIQWWDSACCGLCSSRYLMWDLQLLKRVKMFYEDEHRQYR